MPPKTQPNDEPVPADSLPRPKNTDSEASGENSTETGNAE
jgi:hypothetical protein